MRKERQIDIVRKKISPGGVYRRSELAPYSSNIDRVLAKLVQQGELKKLRNGLYSCPKKSVFGEAPPSEEALLRGFLKEDKFVVYSPSDFNSLGLGTTQLYNKRVVFNRKRSGVVKIGGRTYHFKRWREAPKEASKEFLLVEMMNRLDELAEDEDSVLNKLAVKMRQFDKRKLIYAVDHYGTLSAQNRLKPLLRGA